MTAFHEIVSTVKFQVFDLTKLVLVPNQMHSHPKIDLCLHTSYINLPHLHGVQFLAEGVSILLQLLSFHMFLPVLAQHCLHSL